MTNEALLDLIAEFMNLIHEIDDAEKLLTPIEEIHTFGYRATVSDYLMGLGYDAKQIARFWTGEDQLTSS